MGGAGRDGDLPAPHDRFQEWVEAGVWIELWRVLLEEYDELRRVGLVVSERGRKHDQGAASHGGGKESGPNPTDRGKRGGTRSVFTETAGVPVGVTVAGANRNDHLLLEETLTGIVVRRPKPTRTRPQGLCLDKGYDHASTREIAARLRLTLHPCTRGEEAKAKRRGAKARRWVVERAHSWLNRFRCLLVRWEKKASNHEAMLHLACATIVAGQAGLFG